MHLSFGDERSPAQTLLVSDRVYHRSAVDLGLQQPIPQHFRKQPYTRIIGPRPTPGDRLSSYPPSVRITETPYVSARFMAARLPRLII